ncbi:MAG: hypothetical protein QOH50_4048 [Kribbellaceae bacterium]|nr:hypothetical protein [Kribbellaceae bacterium]
MVQTHPVFTDIALHSDDELMQLLGSGIEERETIHAWPLSCVQQVWLANGRRLVYKSQLPPTVEPEFYQAASSALLADHRLLETLGDSRGRVRTAPRLPSAGAKTRRCPLPADQ